MRFSKQSCSHILHRFFALAPAEWYGFLREYRSPFLELLQRCCGLSPRPNSVAIGAVQPQGARLAHAGRVLTG